MPSAFAVYNGTHPKVVLAFDVSGTTHSMISYCILTPGKSPQIKDVTKFPGQALVQADRSMPDGYRPNWEVPMRMCYDRTGTMMKAAGFEASLREKDGTVAKEKWIAVSSLRFRLRSKGVFIVFSQPQGKTPTVLFADFLSYLLLCARLHIADVEGQEIWNSVKENIDFILVIPNGWGNEEKEALRSAAIRGDLIPNHSNRLRFVKKGEATLHFGNHSDEQLSIWLKKGKRVVIADLERRIMDVSAYRLNPRQLSNNEYRELVAPTVCVDEDACLVSMAVDFRDDIALRLKGSLFEEALDTAVGIANEKFSEFQDPEKPLCIKFGSTRDADRIRRIRNGQIEISLSWVATELNPSIQSLVTEIVNKLDELGQYDGIVILVGFFSNSDWIVSRVEKLVKERRFNANVFRLEHHKEETITNHGISFFLDDFMGIRVSEATYGVMRPCRYEENRYEHQCRKALRSVDAEGKDILMGAFFQILPLDTQVSLATEEFRGTFEESFYELSDQFSLDIWAYFGIAPWQGGMPGILPIWWDEDKDNYQYLCTINASDPGLQIRLSRQKNRNGRTFYKLKFDVVISFSLNEMKAQIAWREKGVERRTPATIIEVYSPKVEQSIQSELQDGRD